MSRCKRNHFVLTCLVCQSDSGSAFAWFIFENNAIRVHGYRCNIQSSFGKMRCATRRSQRTFQSQAAPTRKTPTTPSFADHDDSPIHHHSAERKQSLARPFSLPLEAATTPQNALQKLLSSSPQHSITDNEEVAPVARGASLRPNVISSSLDTDPSASQQINQHETLHISFAHYQSNPVRKLRQPSASAVPYSLQLSKVLPSKHIY